MCSNMYNVKFRFKKGVVEIEAWREERLPWWPDQEKEKIDLGH